jgi:23S rRNA-/tRNA-specific pseudouridylate synthase
MLIIYKGTGERIDTRLSKEFSYSRNFFHHIIAREGIRVNALPIKKSYQLKPQDQIFIDNLSRYLSPVLLEEAPVINIPLLIEKEDYLIINKPKGVLSHPNSIRDVKQPSVVGFLYHHFKDLPSYGNFIRAGLIHRLDKETDGIMVIAKTEKGLQHFKTLFQKKSESLSIEEKEAVPLQKFYRATCEITPEGEIFLQEIADHLPYYLIEEVVAKVSNRTPKMGITKIESFNILHNSLECSEQIL